MSPTALQEAFEPQRPGLAVRSLGSVLPGVRRTGEQIEQYAREWRREADVALTSGQPVLAFLGDSLSQGIGASSRANSYAALTAAAVAERCRMGPSVLNLSRSGARIDDVIGVQLPALDVASDRGLTVVAGVCTIGSNDLLRSTRLKAVKQRLTVLLERLPPTVLLATVPDTGSVVAKRLNHHLRTEAERLEQPVADVAAALTSWRGQLAGDRFHPNDEGHRLWADVVLETLLGQGARAER